MYRGNIHYNGGLRTNMGKNSSIWSRIRYVLRSNLIMSLLLYRLLAHTVAILHLLIIILNFLSIPFVIAYEPFYIWMPVITFLVSPLVGGTYCMYNRLENHFRRKALMPLIQNRSDFIFKQNP